MATFAVPHIRMAGLAAAVPQQQEANLDYQHIPEKDRKLLVKTTGIHTRRLAPAGMTASDLCVAAATPLLEALNWAPASIDALVFVSQTPDYQMPGTAVLLQDRLQLPHQCLAFDINQGCAGYVYGLGTLASLLSSGNLKRALLLVGDTITHTLSPEDKSTWPIFSDAGSATALEYAPEAPPMHFNLQSDGSRYQAIIVPEGGARQPIRPESLQTQEIAPGIHRAPNQMAMQGLDIFNFGLREVAPNLKALMKGIPAEPEAFDYFIFHQANRLLNESIRKKLSLPPEKVPYSLRDYGNTSCATLPVTMVTQIRASLQSQPLQLALSGFGVGLSWGSAAIRTQPLICPPLVEIA